MLTYTVVIPTITGRGRADILARDLACSERPPEYVLIIDNETVYDVPQHASNMPARRAVYRPGRNLGVAASWNYGIQDALNNQADVCILANDDVEVEPHTTRVLLEALEETNDPIAGPTTRPFTFLAVRVEQALTEIGLFDEQFYPAYFEDDDYLWRLQIAGYADLLRVDVVDMGISWPTHGTTRAEADPALRKLIDEGYERSRDLYEQKWGAQPPHELFARPNDPTSARWWWKNKR